MTTEDNELRAGTIVPRPWGYYKVIVHEEGYSVKMLHINPGESTSFQRHSKRHELITILEGRVNITIDNHTFCKEPSKQISSYRIPIKTWHRFGVPEDHNEPSVILEIAYGELDPEDFQRSEDKYDRERSQGTGFIEDLFPRK